MKRILSAILCLICLTTVLYGCEKSDKNADGKIKIVTTVFPIYDWTKQLLGENIKNAELTLLLDNGVDLHSYQPTADDIIKISTCDIFIYVGGESDEWVENTLKSTASKNMTAVNLLESLGDYAKEEAHIEGEHHSGEESEEEHEHEYDEHIWLSLKNAARLCKVISEKLKLIDGENAADYSTNADNYISKLNELDARYTAAVESATIKTFLFCDRFPFRYLADDYGISYFAAFSGCSAESEADFETITFLSGKIDELGLSAVLILEGSDKRIAETVIANTDKKDQRIFTIDSMQSTTSADAKNGISYISVMESNLNVLKSVFNRE